MQVQKQKEQEFSFKSYFVPLTTTKAIHWIIVIGIIVYANMLFNGFVWDDNEYIVNNLQVHHISIIDSFGGNYFNIAGQYRPLVDFYFSLLYSAFGTTPFFYHALQLLLHIICTVILYLFFRKFTLKEIALIGAVLFLIHPIQVESVSFIAQTTSPLFFLFGIIPLLIMTKKKFGEKEFILIYCFSLLSLFAKETGILFIFLLLIYALLFAKAQMKKLALVSLFSFVTYLFFRLIVGHIDFSPRSLVPIAVLSLPERLITMPAIILYYIKTFFYPLILSNDQQWTVTSLTFSDFYFPLIIDIAFLIILGIFGIVLYKKNKSVFKAYVFFVSWFILGMGLLLQIFPLELTVADRWFYFPFAGLLGIMVVLLQSSETFWKQHVFLGATVILLVIFSLSIRTIIRNTDWKNNLTLFTNAAKTEDNYDIEDNLGDYFFENKNYVEAREHYQLSVFYRPIEPSMMNLANTDVVLLDIAEAKKNFALAFHAQSFSIYDFHMHSVSDYAIYGYLLVLTDSPVKAEQVIQQGLTEYPQSSDLWYLDALVKYKIGNRKKALVAAQDSYQLNPSDTTKKLYVNIKNGSTFPIINTTLHQTYIIKPGNVD
jgi:hypothetical protein